MHVCWEIDVVEFGTGENDPFLNHLYSSDKQ